ncbi:XRE family transcriptional regulator [Fimbriimonas ginsengisoli]|uniref:Transcriptional regulator protein n=1 Tax=Fimbriimonas ginsengisoli Gsoil 348 TaxID=661478 RepID=A0A068NLJ6_FIMGI|nr:XRE family transcriptional regulator [Fimbriimonas ginsengisoli]AIE84438.1 transcriptional regulator protein [Fimbriimonas ginsengisoli Gsoil 348]
MSESENLAEFGASMRRNRNLLGYTVRDLAELAGISKNTLLRVESGLPVQKATREKLCRALGMVPTDPASRRPGANEGAYYRLHTNADAVWYATKVNRNGEAESSTNERIGDPAERSRLGWYGLADNFGRPLRCRREGSRLIPFVVEVYRPSDITADPSGERFVYGLRGKVRVVVGEESFVLQEGEAATYDATQPNGLEPCDPVTPGHPAPLVLQIVLP